MAPELPRKAGKADRLQDDLPPELAMARLPAGRHGLSRSFIESNQHQRIVAAMLAILPLRGYPAITIGDITAEAGVSRSSFYGQFKSKQDCFLATFDFCAGWFCKQIEEAVVEEDDWRGRVRTGTAETLRLLAVNPQVAHLIAIEAGQAGRPGRERQESFLGRFATVLRADHPGRPDLPDDFADLLLGGFVTQVARYVDKDRTEQLPEATRTLVEYLLVPYLGGEAAHAVAAEMPAG